MIKLQHKERAWMVSGQSQSSSDSSSVEGAACPSIHCCSEDVFLYEQEKFHSHRIKEGYFSLVAVAVNELIS